MARRVFADFSTELNLRLGKRADITPDMREQILNDALLSVGSEYLHPQLQKTTTESWATGDLFTPITADIWWPDTVKDLSNGRIITPGDKEIIENIKTKPTSDPSKWYWWGGNICFNSNTATTRSIKLWYTARPAWWNDGLSVFDVLFDQVISMYAVKIGFETLRDFTEAANMFRAIQAYTQQKKLPLRQKKLQDHGTGIKVRMS